MIASAATRPLPMLDALMLCADFVNAAHDLDDGVRLGVSARDDFGLVVQVLALPGEACDFPPLNLPHLSIYGVDLFASLRQLGDQLLHKAGRRDLMVAVIIGPRAWDEARRALAGRAA